MRSFDLASEKAILFDMDGVLLDTEPLYGIAWDRMLEPFGFSLDRTFQKEKMAGRPALVSARHVVEKYGLDVTPESLIERRKPILEELVRNAPAFPFAEAFVREVARKGIKRAVATSTTRAVLRVKIEKHPWFSIFDTIVCSDDPDVGAPKPAPDIFLAAAKRLGTIPSECTIFEDSRAGIEAALATGAFVVAVVPGEGAPSFGAHRAISSFAELL